MSLTILDQNDKKELEKKIDDTKTGPIDPSRIKDMYYEEDGEVVEIFPETTLTADPENDPGTFVIEENYPELVIGTTYKVVWNGTEYTGTAIDGNPVNMGDVVLVNDGTDLSTGEGIMFAIVYAAGGGIMFMDPNASAELTVSIFADNRVIRKIPNKYLDLEWLPIMNKFLTTLYDGTIRLATSYLCNLSEPLCEIIDGEEYTVIWNGTEYKCIGHNFVYSGFPIKYLGNASMTTYAKAAGHSTDTGEPFAYEYASDSSTHFITVYGTENNVDVTLTIIGPVEEPSTLPPKFLPMDDIIQAVKDSIPTWEGGSY